MLNNLQKAWSEQQSVLQQKIEQTPAYHSWQGLQVREKQLVKALLIFLFITFLYMIIWSPIVNGSQQALQKMQNAEATWAWLNKQQQTMPSSSSQVKAVLIKSQSQLTSYLQQQIARQNLKQSVAEIIPINSRGSEGIEVVFNQVNSPRFFRWLSKMEQEGVLASELNLTKLKPGIVSAKVTFEMTN